MLLGGRAVLFAPCSLELFTVKMQHYFFCSPWAFLPFHFEFSNHNEIKMIDAKWKFSGSATITPFSVAFFFILVNIHLAASGAKTNDYNFASNKRGDKYCNYIK